MPVVSEQLEQFAAGFRRSKRGNLWRQHGEHTVTVFLDRGQYGWCFSGNEERSRYSPGRYATEAEALAALWQEVG